MHSCYFLWFWKWFPHITFLSLVRLVVVSTDMLHVNHEGLSLKCETCDIRTNEHFGKYDHFVGQSVGSNYSTVTRESEQMNIL